jgi:hypothetical protein
MDGKYVDLRLSERVMEGMVSSVRTDLRSKKHDRRQTIPMLR